MINKEYEFIRNMTDEQFNEFLQGIEGKSNKIDIEKRDNFIAVSSEGGYEAVADRYYHLITNDFNLTVDDICNYLMISRNTFNSKDHNYRLMIKHIYINAVARIALMKENEDINEELGGIKLKKVLYSNKDFERFLKENVKVEKFARRVSNEVVAKYNDFDISKYECVLQNIFTLGVVEKPRKINGKTINNIKKVTTIIDEVPEILVDYKFVMEKKGMHYNAYFYDFVRTKWLDRYILNGNVRYNYNMVFADDRLIIPYVFLKGLTNNQLLNMSDEDIFEYFLEESYDKIEEYYEMIQEDSI